MASPTTETSSTTENSFKTMANRAEVRSAKTFIGQVAGLLPDNGSTLFNSRVHSKAPNKPTSPGFNN